MVHMSNKHVCPEYTEVDTHTELHIKMYGTNILLILEFKVQQYKAGLCVNKQFHLIAHY